MAASSFHSISCYRPEVDEEFMPLSEHVARKRKSQMIVANLMPGPNTPSGIAAKARQLEALLFAQVLAAGRVGAMGVAAGAESPFAGLLREQLAQQLAASADTGLADAVGRTAKPGPVERELSGNASIAVGTSQPGLPPHQTRG
jgi:Rod binding domain-containing protein